MQMSENAIFQGALVYTQMGYPVFPCVPDKKQPLTRHGFKDATTDWDQITEWWMKWPNANIGLPTAGMIVIDVDGPDNLWPEDPSQHFDISESVISNTPSGGTHYIFQSPPWNEYRNTSGQIAPKVDTRANGGYIIAVPSIVNGIQYEYVKGNALNRPLFELPLPPGWLMDLLV